MEISKKNILFPDVFMQISRSRFEEQYVAWGILYIVFLWKGELYETVGEKLN